MTAPAKRARDGFAKRVGAAAAAVAAFALPARAAAAP